MKPAEISFLLALAWFTLAWFATLANLAPLH